MWTQVLIHLRPAHRADYQTVDKDGKKFDRGKFWLIKLEYQVTNIAVSRIQATSHNTNSELTLDIAPELYALAPEETFTLALAKSLVQEELDVNGEEEDEDAPKKVKRELWRSEDQGLAADYEYVMYGKVSFFTNIAWA